MRWPFRRREAAPPPAPSTPDNKLTAGTGRRAWQTLPPLAPVVGRPRLTLSAPPVSGTRPLLHRAPTSPPPDRPAGTVAGLAEVLPALDATRPEAAPPAPRPVRAVTRPAEPPPLTSATPDFVGEPREPAQPHRAPAWLRALSAAPVFDPLLGAVMPAAPAPSPPRQQGARQQGARQEGARQEGQPARLRGAEPDQPTPGSAPAGQSDTPLPGAELSGRQGAPPGIPGGQPAGRLDGQPATWPAGRVGARPTGLPTPPQPTSPARPAPPRLVRPRRGVGLGAPLAAEPADPEPAPPAPPTRSPGSPAAPTAIPAPIAIRPPASPEPGTSSHPMPRQGKGDHPATAASSAQGTTSHSAPDDLVRDVAHAAGADLHGVLVHRGPDVDRRATEAGAAAYTVDDAVHLPSAAGHGDQARALVAHELVHVAQQRLLGTDLPDEASPAGAALEADAVAVEHAVRAGRALPPLQHPRVVRAQAPRIDAAPPRPLSGGLAATVDGQIGVLRQPNAGSRVQGRLQRAPTETSHPAAPAAARPTGTERKAEAERKAETERKAEEEKRAERWSGFKSGLTNDLKEIVFDSWRIDEPQADDKKAGKTAGADRAAGTGKAAGNSAPAGEESRQERFNQLARPALERLNEQRLAAGQSELIALPPEEEKRIWDQVDAGGATGTGKRAKEPPPIHNWSDFKSAWKHDLADVAGDWLGVEGSDVLGWGQHKKDEPAPEQQRDAHAANTAPAGHKPIDTDDLDLDELTARLYDRIRSRLRLELLLDRERAGLLSDFR